MRTGAYVIWATSPPKKEANTEANEEATTRTPAVESKGFRSSTFQTGISNLNRINSKSGFALRFFSKVDTLAK